jgi:UDP-N-acetylmuramoylalanine--D-glutamate ligase
MEFAKKKVLVVGMGKSGLSAGRWLSKQGAEVIISDIKTESEIGESQLRELANLGVRLEAGGHKEKTFTNVDMIIVSPGIPLDMPPLQIAKRHNIPIMGEMALAVELVDIPIVAVTGTNGKSTAVSLIGSMLKNTGIRVFIGGNIGTPFIDYVAGGQKVDYAVLEVSSFQLDTMERFSPTVSLLLNISPDHLDRYTDYEDYVRSKLRICESQGYGQYAILNDDDARLADFIPKGDIAVLRYGLKERENRHAFVDRNKLVARLSKKRVTVFDLTRYALPGEHNLGNLMGSVLAVLALNSNITGIQGTINHFKGLPHRMERIARIRGVDFINDSKATNVDASVRSITSFNRPVILIAGGRHKGADYAPLVTAAKSRVKKVILLGEARTLIADAFTDIIPFQFADTMEEAVLKAFTSAEADDVVLLAPACASFDMFADYADRGNRFRQAVERIDHGS